MVTSKKIVNYLNKGDGSGKNGFKELADAMFAYYAGHRANLTFSKDANLAAAINSIENGSKVLRVKCHCGCEKNAKHLYSPHIEDCDACGSSNVVVPLWTAKHIRVKKSVGNMVTEVDGKVSYPLFVVKKEIGNEPVYFFLPVNQEAYFDIPAENGEDIFDDTDKLFLSLRFKIKELYGTGFILFIFSERIGFKILNRAGDNLRPTSSSSCSTFFDESDGCDIAVDNDAYGDFLKAIGYAGGDIQAAVYAFDTLHMQEKKEKQKKKSFSNDAGESILGKLLFDDKVEQLFAKNLKDGFFIPFNVEKNTLSYAAACSNGHGFNGSTAISASQAMNLSKYEGEVEKIEVICPVCGKKMRFPLTIYQRNSWEKTVSFLQPLKDGFAIRGAYCSMGLSADGTFVKNEPVENMRIIVQSNKMMSYVRDKEDDKNSVWKQSSRSDKLNIGTMLFSKQELTDTILNSPLKTIGLLQAWGLEKGLENRQVEKMLYFGSDSYLRKYYKQKYLEQLVKADIPSLTSSLITATDKPDWINPDGKNVCEILGVPKAALKVIRARNLRYQTIPALKECFELMPDFTVETWDAMLSTGRGFLPVCRATHTSIPRLLDYIQACYDFQCIEKKDALEIFRDYYEMAEQCGYNLDDKRIKFPSSLKKEHDKAVFAMRAIKQEREEKAFSKAVGQYGDLAYENDDYAIIVPTSADEVIKEGQNLHHCVSTYVRRIADGECCIVFVREKNNMDNSFFTCEVRNHEINQLHGFSNRNATKGRDDKLISFIEEWASVKGMEIPHYIFN